MADRDTFGVMGWLRLLSTIVWIIIFVNWPRMTFAVTLVIIGGVFIAFLPVAGSWVWAWVPLVIDWGGFPIFLVGWRTERSES